MKTENIKKLTPHQDINDILAFLSENLERILGDSLVGLYLTGSLTYGDFDRGSSDIDFLVVLDHPLSDKELREVKNIHTAINEKYLMWSERIEGSYITKDMLKNANPPKTPRPYINCGSVKISVSVCCG